MNILTGPPLENKADDARMVQDFMKQEGIKIVSGGITSQIVARELGTASDHFCRCAWIRKFRQQQKSRVSIW